MRSSKVLSLSNNFKYYSKFMDIIILDDNFSVKKKNDKRKIEKFKKKAKDKKQLNKVYSYSEKIYHRLLSDLTNQLNIIHNLKKKERYWEIIVGCWLIDFILISLKNFLTIEKVLKKRKISKCIVMKNLNESLHTLNTIEAANGHNDSDWNFALNSKILKFLNPKMKLIHKNSKFKYFKMKFLNFEKTKTDIFKNLGFINNVFKDKKIFIYKSSLPFISEKLLELKLGQLPSYWTTKEPLYKKFSKEFRQNFNLNSSIRKKDKFESFIRKEIPYALPIFMMESFKENMKLANQIFPKNPKKIFTCVSWQADELFKLYLADRIDNAKYFCGQHGNNVFTAYQSRISLDIKCPDKFLSWGYKNLRKNIIPVSNFKCIGKISEKRYFDPKGKLLIIFDKVGLNKSPFERNDLSLKKITSTLSIIKDLKLEQKKNIILRLCKSHKNEFGGYYYNKYLKKNSYKKDILSSNIRSLQLKSRLNFFNYYSTGMLENFVLNIPTVCYLVKDLEYHNDFLMSKMKYLEKANIVFYEKRKLLKHIYHIWDDVDSWWSSKKTQNLIKKFNFNFNLPDNSINNLARILKN